MGQMIVAFAALALAALAVLSRPWWRRGTRGSVGRRGANIAAYRTRVAELERDAEAGLLPAGEVEELKREAGARLVGDTGAGEVEPPASTMPRLLGPALLLVLMAGSGFWYWQAGSWQDAEQIAAGPDAEPQLPPEVQAMVARLAERLKDHPDDPEGWSQLGRSYFVMQRFEDSAKAYNEANARNGGQDAAMLSAEGEALAFANGLNLSPVSRALFEQALKIDPDDGRALWYGGLGAAQAGDYAIARERWTKLRSRELPERMQQMLDRAIAQLDEPQQAPASAPATVADAPAAAAGPAVSLPLRISLAPVLAAQLGKGDTLFVFAKADGGPPMPLAVYRAPAGSFPVEVVLNDGMAMAPALRLSAFAHYVVTARLSRSGQAQAQPGDLEGSAKLDRASATGPVAPSEIIIDRVVR